jgi:hypothetical protein
MDDFISVLKKGAAGAAKGAVLPVAGLAAGLINALGLVQYSPAGAAALNDTTSLVPLIAVTTMAVLLPLIVLPFLLGGALGYAVEAVSGGRPGWPAFVSSGKRHYVRLLAAGIVAWIIFYLLALMTTVLFAFGALAPALLPVVVILALAVMFVCLMLIEFYDISIVSEGTDFFRAFAASAGFASRHLSLVVPFFLIVAAAKVVAQLPIFTAIFVRTVAELAANFSYYNGTANGTLNSTYANATLLAAQTAPFSLPALLGVAILQVLAQAVAFAFVVYYKAEFYRWVKGIKRITDFDYDFSQEKE